MGKGAKEHRKKVEARNARIKKEKEKVQKMQRDFIMNLIEQEKQKGMFDNTPTIDPVGPTIDTNTTPSIDPIEGPQI